MMKVLSFALALLLLLSGTAYAEPLPQEDYYGRYMAATTEEERQAVLDEMPDTRYAAYDAESGKWGLIDRVGRWVVEPSWDEARTFAKGQYALVAVFSEVEELNYFIVDRNGEPVARLPDSFDDISCNFFSDQLTVEIWDDGVELLFDANLGRFLNESGIVSGEAGLGYVFECINPYFTSEFTLGYPLNGDGLPYCEGLWFDPTLPFFLPPDEPDAEPMATVYWNNDYWEEVVEYYPEIVEQYGGDLSWVASRPEGYSLLDAEGNIVATAPDRSDFLWESSNRTDSWPDDAIVPPSSAGLYWTWADEDDHVQLTDTQGNVYHTMYFAEWSFELDSYFLTPYDDFFLFWDEQDDSFGDRNNEGFLRADGSVLYPPQFDYAHPFLDGLAYVTWYDPLPQWKWDAATEARYDDYFFPDTPYWEANPSGSPSLGCYIDAFGHIVYSCDGLPRTILTETTPHSTTKE